MAFALSLLAASASHARVEIASKTDSTGAGPPATHKSRSLTVFGDGKVEIEVNNHGKHSVSTKKLGAPAVSALKACAAEASKAKQLPTSSGCAGGSYQSYTVGKSVISRHACGDAVVKSPCVAGAMKTLDGL